MSGAYRNWSKNKKTQKTQTSLKSVLKHINTSQSSTAPLVVAPGPISISRTMCCHDNHTQMHIHNPKHFSATTVSLSVKKFNISRAQLLLTPWKENDWKQNLYKRSFLTPNCVRIWTPFYSGLHLFVAIIWSTLWFGSQITHSYADSCKLSWKSLQEMLGTVWGYFGMGAHRANHQTGNFPKSSQMVSVVYHSGSHLLCYTVMWRRKKSTKELLVYWKWISARVLWSYNKKLGVKLQKVCARNPVFLAKS